jgi:hypothetical protein
MFEILQKKKKNSRLTSKIFYFFEKIKFERKYWNFKKYSNCQNENFQNWLII